MYGARLVVFFVGILIVPVDPEAIAQLVPCLPPPSTGPAAGGVATVPPTPPMAMMVNPQSAEEKRSNSKAIEECAKLKSLISPANAKLLGFDTAQDVLLIHIGKPLDIRTIGINSLRAYRPGDPVAPLILQLDSRLYPLSVDGNVRSSLVVSRIQGTDTFTGTAWGLVKLITLVTKYKKADSDFVVWIPALNLHFLGNRPDESLMLTPLATRKLYGLIEGVPVQAAVVFALLAQQARAHDENSPG